MSLGLGGAERGIYFAPANALSNPHVEDTTLNFVWRQHFDHINHNDHPRYNQNHGCVFVITHTPRFYCNPVDLVVFRGEFANIVHEAGKPAKGGLCVRGEAIGDLSARNGKVGMGVLRRTACFQARSMGEDGLASECCIHQDRDEDVRKAAADAISTVAHKDDETSLEALRHALAKDSGLRFLGGGM